MICSISHITSENRAAISSLVKLAAGADSSMIPRYTSAGMTQSSVSFSASTVTSNWAERIMQAAENRQISRSNSR